MEGTMHMPLDYWFIRDSTPLVHKRLYTTLYRGGVRNLGKPVALCKRYYEEGADEVSHPARLCQVGVG